MNKIHMSIMQWNMCCGAYSSVGRTDFESLAELLTHLLEEHEPEIVTLQEASRTLLSYANLTNYDIYAPIDDLVTLALKAKYRIAENIDFDKRLNLLALNEIGVNNRGIKVINLHLLSPLRADEYMRRKKLRKYITSIESWRKKHGDKLEIVSGDFNLPPYDEALVDDEGFLANRDLKHASGLRTQKLLSLYNTSWNIFSGQCGALGTFYLNEPPHGPWHIIDQVLLDPNLVLNNKVDVKVITSVKGRSLTTKGVYKPDKRIGSDHFPLLVTIKP